MKDERPRKKRAAGNPFQLRIDTRCANCSSIAMRAALFVTIIGLIAGFVGAAEPVAQNNLKLINAYLAIDKQHPATTRFDSEIPKINAFWKAEGLEVGDKIRVVWVAEDVGEANPKETKISEKTVMTLKRNDEGSLFLARPGGRTWPVGKYRVDFFINGKFTNAVKFTIAQGVGAEVH
jgi:hypothetical protein